MQSEILFALALLAQRDAQLEAERRRAACALRRPPSDPRASRRPAARRVDWRRRRRAPDAPEARPA